MQDNNKIILITMVLQFTISLQTVLKEPTILSLVLVHLMHEF